MRSTLKASKLSCLNWRQKKVKGKTRVRRIKRQKITKKFLVSKIPKKEKINSKGITQKTLNTTVKVKLNRILFNSFYISSTVFSV